MIKDMENDVRKDLQERRKNIQQDLQEIGKDIRQIGRNLRKKEDSGEGGDVVTMDVGKRCCSPCQFTRNNPPQ